MGQLRVTLKRYSSLIAYGGLILLSVSLMAYIVAQRVEIWAQVALVVGAALLVLYLVVEAGRIHTSLTGRTARYGSNALLLSLAFVGIMVMVNVLSARYYGRWDVTASGQYSISEQTVNILQGLQEPVRVIGFFSTANPYQFEVQTELENLLKSYTKHTDKLSYEFVDPDLKPGSARQYEVSNYGTVVFERGDKRQQTNAYDEQSLTTALLKASRDETKSVYFLTGHKERALEDDGEWGYQQLARYLDKNNYRVAPINLTITDTLPADIAVLVLASPQMPLAEREIALIDSYLKNGGKALVLTDPSVENPFGELLTPWGVAFRDDLVLDPASSFPQDLSAVVAMSYGFPEITKGVEGLLTFFPGVRSLQTLQNVTDTVTISPVVQSSDASWGETGYRDEELFGLDATVDTPGPLALAMAVKANDSDTRLVLFGNAEFVSNSALLNVQGAGNRDLFAGAVNWLAEEDQLVAISPKPAEQRLLMIPPGSARLVIFASLILLPLVVIVAGVAMWWRRR